MRLTAMRKGSKTDWKRLAEMEDNAIDTSDIPELDDKFFHRAKIKMPSDQSVTQRLYADVLSWFKSQRRRLTGSH